MKKLDEIFESITSYILNYEEGDIVLISELIDEVRLLKSYFNKNDMMLTLIDSLLVLLGENLKGNNHNITQTISTGIDILQEVNQLGIDNINETILDRISKIVGDKKINIDKTLSNTNNIEDHNVEKETKNDESTEVVNINSDIISTFVVEAEERIVRAQEIILELEDDKFNYDLINELFRIFHTIKGECGFLKIASLGELTHNIESLLDLLRDRKLEITSKIVDILLQGTDYSKQIVGDLKRGSGIIFNRVDISTVVDGITDITSKHRVSLGKILVENNKLTEKDVSNILNKQKIDVFTKKFGEIAVDNLYLSKDELEETLIRQGEKKQMDEKNDKVAKSDPIIKVKASKINYLVDMIGELLISVGQINDVSPAFNQVRKISKAIQFGAMQLKTEKIKNLFSNMKRVARDVSKKLGKDIVVETIGDDLEIDRDLIENLEEPMMHLVRNAIHHGIEKSDDRVAKNKNASGKITIEALRRGNSIIVSIMDDGNGLNKEKILKKAIEKNLIKEEDIKNLNINEIHNFIFMQGFSTADNVDLVSGRGVGMDIVNSVVSSLRGKIEIKSEPNHFTKISLVFPLNTAIIDGMLIRVENDTYILPVTSIINSIKINPKNIHKINNVIPVLDYRDETIPIIDLKEFLELGKSDFTNTIGITVENIDKKKFLFTADEVIAKREVVIKSLGKKFGKLKGITSGTVLSGGRVGLVLDVDQIIEHNRYLEGIC